MHELGIAQSALERVLEEARRGGATCVTRVVLRVGRLSGVDPEALRFAFEVARAETPASGARLDIEDTSAVLRCPSCDLEFAPEEGPPFACPKCCAWSNDIVHGDELDLIRIEMA